jgi:hypothetical protein
MHAERGALSELIRAARKLPLPQFISREGKMKRHSLITAIAALMLFSLPLAAVAGSVLVNNPAWKFIGPNPIEGVQSNFGGVVLGPGFDATGRVTAIAVDATDVGPCGNTACVVFVGTAGGGVWGSGDGGNSFFKLTGTLDPGAATNGSFPQTTVGALALDPTTSPETLYLATGEGNHGDSFWGDGIFSSASLGGSWSQIAGSVSVFDGTSPPASSLFDGFTRIAVDPTHSPPYVYAAATGATGINRAGLIGNAIGSGSWGIWRSTDGGATFTEEPVSQTGGCSETGSTAPCEGDDVVLDPTTGYVYAAVHTGTPLSGTFGDYAVVRSTDSGTTWTSIPFQDITKPTARWEGSASRRMAGPSTPWSGQATARPTLGFSN